VTDAEKQAIVEAVGIAIRAAKTELRAEFEKRLREETATRNVDIVSAQGRIEEWFQKNRQTIVGEIVSTLPKSDPVDVDAIALRAAELIPVPKDGKDADPEFIRSQVTNAVALLPQAKDGKDADEARIIQEIGERLRCELGEHTASLKAAMDSWERPKDGKDAPAVDTAAIVSEVLKQVPRPQDGRSVDPEEVRGIVAAEVSKAVAAIPAPKNGKDGERGMDGQSIHPDTVALMVRDQFEATFARMPKPENGKPGEPGRDALQLEILSAIDPAKSYPRGTYAYHNGGTLRANRNTTAGESVNLLEWDVCLDGWPVFEIEQGEDLRTFTVKFGKTSGQVFVRSFKIPVVLHRGIFKNGNSYERGDQVQRDGSTWICEAEATTAVPDGRSKDWTLSNKAGRDGKDLRPEEPPKPQEPVRLR
jgi:hypothetical protein